MANDIPPELVAQIRRGATRLARRLRAERPAGGLSLNKLAVLSHLHRNGPSTPGEIAAAERQQPQSLTRVIADLEQTGLITRDRDDRDRRQYVLALSPAGRNALAVDAAGRDRWLADALRDLNETERQVLRLAAALMEELAEL
ncbi:MarR family transcriptional regulator [Actinospica durhamensis]|uniref:MarR family transcriptional regulator n=1 Tax=Actinospica durhamensis TaxID=1508375 RepID=A0A941EWB6_9ACTN|nr:MarR family transcriptional regulator [Actinospica durhamensis]MBR7838146.1 MarR family transcriptional regulator [Actinospica durhamensis]